MLLVHTNVEIIRNEFYCLGVIKETQLFSNLEQNSFTFRQYRTFDMLHFCYIFYVNLVMWWKGTQMVQYDLSYVLPIWRYTGERVNGSFTFIICTFKGRKNDLFQTTFISYLCRIFMEHGLLVIVITKWLTIKYGSRFFLFVHFYK